MAENQQGTQDETVLISLTQGQLTSTIRWAVAIATVLATAFGGGGFVAVDELREREAADDSTMQALFLARQDSALTELRQAIQAGEEVDAYLDVKLDSIMDALVRR